LQIVKKIVLLFPALLFSRVIHEEIPYFVPDFPIVLELSFINEYSPQKVGVFWTNSSKDGYQYISMRCSNNHCKATLPAQSMQTPSLNYRLYFKTYNGKEVNSRTVIVNRVTLPPWQTLDGTSLLNIYGDQKGFGGFESGSLLFSDEWREPSDDKVLDKNITIKKSSDGFRFYKIFTP
jgi:hypothetical protein